MPPGPDDQRRDPDDPDDPVDLAGPVDSPDPVDSPEPLGSAEPAVLEPGGPDGAAGDSPHTALPPKVESWRKRSATGAILTGFALGLQQVFEAKRDEPAIVMETSGDPPRDLPVEAQVEQGRPRQSVVQIRPWLIDPAPTDPGGPTVDTDAQPSGPEPTGPEPTGSGSTGSGSTGSGSPDRPHGPGRPGGR